LTRRRAGAHPAHGIERDFVDSLPARVEISTSRAKLIVLVVAGVMMTAASALLAFQLLPSSAIVSGSYAAPVGYVGLAFFGLATLLLVWRLSTAHGVVLTLDAEGIRDRRISDKVIPWSAVRNISTWQKQSQKVMILKIDPAFERQLGFSRFARMARQASRAFGADGLGIGANDLKTDYDTLFATATAFWKARS
jgi:hypothetical protein